MGCRIIEGHEAGSSHDVCCLYDSVTGWAFGPTFADVDEATAFIAFCGDRDPRTIPLDELETLESKFGERKVSVTCDVCDHQFELAAAALSEDRYPECPACKSTVYVDPENEVIAE